MSVGATNGLRQARWRAARDGIRARRPGALSAWGAALAAGLVLLVAGCGLRTAPQPLSRLIPPPPGLRIWNRDGQVLVAWQPLSPRLVARWEGVVAYRLSVARLPLGCAECNPLDQHELALPPDSPELIQDPGATVYRFTPSGPPATWRVRVSVKFSGGFSTDSPPVFLDAVGTIPSQELLWERVGPQTLGADGNPAIRLYWRARRERIVHVVTATGGQLDQDLMYHVNLYRRVPPAAWPELPFNPKPLTGLFWMGPEPSSFSYPAARSVEYRLRLVDQLGNEGPASESVSIPIVKGPGS